MSSLPFLLPGAVDRIARLAGNAIAGAWSALGRILQDDPIEAEHDLRAWADKYRATQPSFASDLEAAIDRYNGIGRG